MMKLGRGFQAWPSRESLGIAIKLRPVLLWASGAMGVFGLLFGFDMIVDGLGEALTAVFEFVEENLESWYRKLFKLDLYHAQMATAYTFFVVSAGIAWLLGRKYLRWFRSVRGGLEAKAEKVGSQCQGYWKGLLSWWKRLDTLNKIFSAFIFIAVIIPFVAVVLIIIGNLIAELA